MASFVLSHFCDYDTHHFFIQNAVEVVCKKSVQECDKAMGKKKWLVFIFLQIDLQIDLIE